MEISHTGGGGVGLGWQYSSSGKQLPQQQEESGLDTRKTQLELLNNCGQACEGSGRKSCDQYLCLMMVGEGEIDQITSTGTRISNRKALDVRQHWSRWMCGLEAALVNRALSALTRSWKVQWFCLKLEFKEVPDVSGGDLILHLGWLYRAPPPPSLSSSWQKRNLSNHTGSLTFPQECPLLLDKCQPELC
jgi:hypothetical protein